MAVDADFIEEIASRIDLMLDTGRCAMGDNCADCPAGKGNERLVSCLRHNLQKVAECLHEEAKNGQD